MLDRLFLPTLGFIAVTMIGLALVWPQGLGDRSPGPLGHTPVQQTPAMKAAMKRESDAASKRLARARQGVSNLQTQTSTPAQ